MPRGVKKISSDAFLSCDKLEKIVIYSDSDVKSVKFNCQNAQIKIIDPSLHIYQQCGDYDVLLSSYSELINLKKESNSEEESDSEEESKTEEKSEESNSN